VVIMRNAIKIFKSLSDPTRLRILMLLLERKLCVCELVFILKMEQSRISHQLRVLREADLVEDKRDGKWINYQIPNKTKEILKEILDQISKENFFDSAEFEEDRKNLAGVAVICSPRIRTPFWVCMDRVAGSVIRQCISLKSFFSEFTSIVASPSKTMKTTYSDILQGGIFPPGGSSIIRVLNSSVWNKTFFSLFSYGKAFI